MERKLTGIFVDTGDLEEVRKYHALGVIRGVTTNPTILAKDGLVGGWSGMATRCREIARLVAPLPVSVEVTTNDPQGMREQAHLFASWGKNIVVKIPIHGPEGGTDNLKLVHELETADNIRINVTAMMSAQQCVLAALAGATYASLFGGRINNMGYNASGEIRRLRGLLDDFALPTKVIVGSTREILNILEWFEAGADIVTALPPLIEGMLIHPYTKETVQMFLRDAQSFHRDEPPAKRPQPAAARSKR